MLLAATNIKLLQRHVYLAKRIIGMNAVAIFKNMVGGGMVPLPKKGALEFETDHFVTKLL